MKTSDGIKMKERNVYFLVGESGIVKTKCRYLSEWSGISQKSCNFYKDINTYYAYSIRGLVYRKYNNALKRYKRLVKDKIKFHRKTLDYYKKELEKLNGD